MANTRNVDMRHAAPRHAAPRHAAPRHAAPRHAAPRHAAPRHAAPRHAAGRTDVRRVFGIGQKKADELRQLYNIRTTYSLRKYVRKIPDILTDAQLSGLVYHDKISAPISWKAADKHAAYITAHIRGAIIAGSYRRAEKKIGDIDVIVTANLDTVVARLSKYIVATLSSGESRFIGVARLPGTSSYRKIDIIRTTAAEKPFALLYFTGDVTRNISMRLKAKRMRYSLTQHGIFSIATGRPVGNIHTERDIFKFLDMDYIEPHNRAAAAPRPAP